jgi:hypothetical protein
VDPVVRGRIGDGKARTKPWARAIETTFLHSNNGMAISTLDLRTLARFSVQRAFRSFRASLAGLAARSPRRTGLACDVTFSASGTRSSSPTRVKR